jgi:hypothetical protein
MHETIPPREQTIILIHRLSHAHTKKILDLIFEMDVIKDRPEWPVRAKPDQLRFDVIDPLDIIEFWFQIIADLDIPTNALMHLRELFTVHSDFLIFIVLSAESWLESVARARGVVLGDRLAVAHY